MPTNPSNKCIICLTIHINICICIYLYLLYSVYHSFSTILLFRAPVNPILSLLYSSESVTIKFSSDYVSFGKTFITEKNKQ